MNTDRSNNSGDPLHLGSRLGTLEQEVSGLKTDINYIRQQIGELAHSFSQFINNSRTNWGVLAAWGTVIITLMIFYNKLAAVPYDNFMVLTEQRNTKIEQVLSDNVQDKKELLEYCITSSIKTEQLEKCIEKVQSDMDQREIWTKADHREYSELISKQIDQLIKFKSDSP